MPGSAGERRAMGCRSVPVTYVARSDAKHSSRSRRGVGIPDASVAIPHASSAMERGPSCAPAYNRVRRHGTRRHENRSSMMRFLPRRLAPRLILATLVFVALGWAISDVQSLVRFEDRVREERITAADQLSRSLTSATWHAMLAGRKDAAYDVMEVMGKDQGVLWIRMFAKMGRVTFSSDPDAPRTVAIESDECRACHAFDPPKRKLAREERVREIETPDGRRSLAVLTPILNEPACSTADCHAHDPNTHVLGILDLSLPLDDVDREVASVQRQTVLFAVLKFLAIGGFLVFFIARFVGRPIRQLIRGTEAVARMDLDQEIHVETDTELGDLAASFETMRARLKEAVAKNEQFTQSLEEKVEERTKQLQSTQRQLIQSDRLASLGKLSASVAHEVNNPISAVLNLTMFLKRILGDDGIPEGRVGEFRRHLGQIGDETERVGRIVSDLLAFSRRSSPRREPVDLNDIVRRTVSLIEHRGTLARVEVAMELGRDLPLVPCDGQQIQQVLLNLLLNALEAIDEEGRVTVRTGLETATDHAVLQVEDTGQGIPEEHLLHVFDPFFSTKLDEKGVGLGLAVAYGIVDAHGGRLDVHSQVGWGTTFNVRLPLHPPAEESDS